MKHWDDRSEDVSKITPDKEKAKSLLQIIALREKRVSSMEVEEFRTLIVEDYYEILMELITAVMSIDGWKTVSHELLIGYLASFYPEFLPSEISIIDQLRRTRNDISYRGVMVNKDYLERNKDDILRVISKLKKTVQRKL